MRAGDDKETSGGVCGVNVVQGVCVPNFMGVQHRSLSKKRGFHARDLWSTRTV